LLGSGARNNRSAVGSGVFYVARPEAISRDRRREVQLVQLSTVKRNELSRVEVVRP
jgi:hypothetical protein